MGRIKAPPKGQAKKAAPDTKINSFFTAAKTNKQSSKAVNKVSNDVRLKTEPEFLGTSNAAVSDNKKGTKQEYGDTAAELEALRQFDLDHKFGPCNCMTRLDRWKRAERFNLHPPVEIKRILEAHPKDEQYIHCLWKVYDL